MRLIFAGTPDFAAVSLRALIAAGHVPGLVLTQPDRPAGRGMKAASGPVKQVAAQHGIAVLQPATLRDADIQARIAAFEPDVMVVAAYGLLLPAEVLAIPKHGCVNIHASLLPRWRGAAPIHRALLAGDAQTGVCIMQMEKGLDTGPVLLRRALPILPDDTAGTLHDRVAELGARAIVEALPAIAAGTAVPVAQPDEGITYAAKLRPEEAALDFTLAAADLERAVRAWNPWPAAHATLKDQTIKIWTARAETAAQGALPGTVLGAGADGIAIACGAGTLVAIELQRPGRGRLRAGDFLRGFPIAAGDRFTT